MSEKQKQAIEKLAENIDKWDDEQRGFLLGYMECMAQTNQQKQEEKKEGE